MQSKADEDVSEGKKKKGGKGGRDSKMTASISYASDVQITGKIFG